MISYIEAIGLGFPGVGCSVNGDGTVYENIVWESGSPIPEKATLDEWIAANELINADKRITVLAFRNRFTQQEKIAIDLASLDNPSASMQQRAIAATLRVAMADLLAATFVDLTRQDTVASVTQLETLGILGAGRADDILNGPILAIERYHG